MGVAHVPPPPVSFAAVLPYAWGPWFDECAPTLAPELAARTLFVDNTTRNRGVMRSHNMGIDYARDLGADWLIVMSAALRFGAPGGRDFLAALDTSPERIVEAADVYGWHLIAFRLEVLDLVGRWDENFTPYGYDDLDLSWRIQTAYGLDTANQTRPLWTKVPVDVADAGMGHSVKLAGVTGDDEVLRAYYRKKWGYLPGVEPGPDAHRAPFGNPALPIGWWPTTRDGMRYDGTRAPLFKGDS